MSKLYQSPLLPHHLARSVTLAVLAAVQTVAADQTRSDHAHPHLEEIVVKGQKLDHVSQAWSSTHFDNRTLREFKIAEPEAVFERVGAAMAEFLPSGAVKRLRLLVA